jgi:hypothetical protein
MITATYVLWALYAYCKAAARLGRGNSAHDQLRLASRVRTSWAGGVGGAIWPGPFCEITDNKKPCMQYSLPDDEVSGIPLSSACELNRQS